MVSTKLHIQLFKLGFLRNTEQGTELLTRIWAGYKLHSVIEWSFLGDKNMHLECQPHSSRAGCPFVFICSFLYCYFHFEFGKSVHYTQESEQFSSGHSYVIFWSVKVICILSCSQMSQDAPWGHLLVTAHCEHHTLYVAFVHMALTLHTGLPADTDNGGKLKQQLHRRLLEGKLESRWLFYYRKIHHCVLGHICFCEVVKPNIWRNLRHKLQGLSLHKAKYGCYIYMGTSIVLIVKPFLPLYEGQFAGNMIIFNVPEKVFRNQG